MPTISDVAKRAGVSVGTVSNVINNAENVAPATREKVERAINELGYVPNGVARSLRSRRTRWLALVVPTITNAHWHAIVRGVEDAAQSRGYAVLLGNTDDNLVKQRQYLDVAISQSVAGVIIAPCDSDAEKLTRLRKRNIPTVTINRRIDNWDIDGVFSDSISGARALVRHLVDLGHKRIAMISGPRHLTTVQDRIAGYCIALAEAGVPVEPQFIKSGEFQATSGEYLTDQALDEGLNPTAIFAANNQIGLGVISALGKRGLRIPQDVALVCFGDFAEAYFPFMTVTLEPAYEMGMNAAQLLFSRLDAGEDLSPRQVVLPTRLIVRYSCGSKHRENGDSEPCLLVPKDTQSQSVLVKTLSPEEQSKYSECIDEMIGQTVRTGVRLPENGKSDIDRLLQVLQHRQADRLPHLEFQISSRPLYEYVLGRKLECNSLESQVDVPPVTPVDHVEFVQRLGMDAVTCDFSWRPGCIFKKAADGTRRYVNGTVKSWTDLDHLEPPPSLADQLSTLERYLKAAQDTGVGVAASFSGFLESATLAVGLSDVQNILRNDRRFLETFMDILLDHQQKVVRAVCDRFGEDLAFVLINDAIVRDAAPIIASELFETIFPQRMKRLIAPAKEHAKLVVLSADGDIEAVLPALADIGFDAAHPVQPGVEHISHLKQQWAGKLALLGGFPTQLLIGGSQDEIKERVRQMCAGLASGGGYVFGCSTAVIESVPAENFVAMVNAVHQYGHS